MTVGVAAGGGSCRFLLRIMLWKYGKWRSIDKEKISRKIFLFPTSHSLKGRSEVPLIKLRGGQGELKKINPDIPRLKKSK